MKTKTNNWQKIDKTQTVKGKRYRVTGFYLGGQNISKVDNIIKFMRKWGRSITDWVEVKKIINKLDKPPTKMFKGKIIKAKGYSRVLSQKEIKAEAIKGGVIKIEGGDKFLAIFKPKVTKDLRKKMIPNIGKEIIIRAEWIADEEYCTGIYADQWVMSSEDLSHTAPEEDFEIIKKL